MRLPVFTSCIFVCCFCILTIGFGQNQSAEFIESSSPLPGGGQVISRSTPGSEIQTVATSPAGTNRSVLNNRSSVVESGTESQRNSVLKQATGNNLANQVRYPYPSSSAFATGPTARLAGGGLFYPPVRASRTCTNCAVPFQVPTLGISGTTTAAKQVYGTGNCCTPQLAPTTTLQVPALQAPVLQVQPPANQVPTLAVPGQTPAAFSPGFTPSFNPNFQPVPPPPGVGAPQFGSQANSFWTPFVRGSGVYQPVIRIANLRPGTYLGQGIIGQPTAYVDGQPLRNLLRYIFP